MENESVEVVAFELILHAGNAKSKSMESIYASREGDLKIAEINLEEAREELVMAHKSQTKMVFSEAKGETIQLNVLLVHALDHMAMAMLSCEIAEEVVLLRKEIRGERI